MFLESEELIDYTGYKQPSRQIKCLRERGVPHDISGDKPVVLRAAIEQRLGLRTRPDSEKKSRLNLTPMRDE